MKRHINILGIIFVAILLILGAVTFSMELKIDIDKKHLREKNKDTKDSLEIELLKKQLDSK